MFSTFLGSTVALLLLLGSGCPTPVVEYDKGLRYEEYVVHHEISAGDARNSALTMDLRSVTAPPGCQDCTPEEKRYCLGADLINDHCCCDIRHEVLPYIPHTCYTGSQLCATVMNSCEQYSRLRTCCCDKIALEKWKDKFKNSSSDATSRISFTLILSYTILYIFVKYFT